MSICCKLPSCFTLNICSFCLSNRANKEDVHYRLENKVDDETRTPHLSKNDVSQPSIIIPQSCSINCNNNHLRLLSHKEMSLLFDGFIRISRKVVAITIALDVVNIIFKYYDTDHNKCIIALIDNVMDPNRSRSYQWERPPLRPIIVNDALIVKHSIKDNSKNKNNCQFSDQYSFKILQSCFPMDKIFVYNFGIIGIHIDSGKNNSIDWKRFVSYVLDLNPVLSDGMMRKDWVLEENLHGNQVSNEFLVVPSFDNNSKKKMINVIDFQITKSYYNSYNSNYFLNMGYNNSNGDTIRTNCLEFCNGFQNSIFFETESNEYFDLKIEKIKKKYYLSFSIDNKCKLPPFKNNNKSGNIINGSQIKIDYKNYIYYPYYCVPLGTKFEICKNIYQTRKYVDSLPTYQFRQNTPSDPYHW